MQERQVNVAIIGAGSACREKAHFFRHDHRGRGLWDDLRSDRLHAQ